MQRSSRLWAASLLVFGGGLALLALLPDRTAAQPIEGGIPPPLIPAPRAVQPGAEPARPGVLPQPGQPVRPGTLPVIPPLNQNTGPNTGRAAGQTAGETPGQTPAPRVGQFTGGQRYTVVESQGVNLLVVDNTSNVLYFYTCDQNKEAGSDLKLRGSIDLNQVGQPVIRTRGHPAEQPGQTNPPTRPAPPTPPARPGEPPHR